MQHKILFTSDLHGNQVQYRKLVNHAIVISADSIIIGGDVAPKGLYTDSFIDKQRHFLKKTLPGLLSPVKEKLPNSKILFMPGNDDCAANLDVLEKYDPSLFHLIHAKRLKLTEKFDIVGYSFVPITPFGIKDWEKYDLSEVSKHYEQAYRKKKINSKLFGHKSKQSGWEEFTFTPEMEKEDSIQKDLSDKLFNENAGKTVCVFHSPPYDTNLDQNYHGIHTGSIAVRLFIEEHQPHLTLHGHIHETVEQSNDYRERIGRTLCSAAGNHDFGHQLAVLEFNLYAPSNVARKVI